MRPAVPSNRAVAVAVIVAAHAAGFAAIGAGGATPVAAARPAIVLRDVAEASRLEVTPPPPTFVPVAVDLAAPVFATGDAADAGKCELASAVQEALANDDAIRRAIDAVPPASRSVANAVTVWNGAWTALGGSVWADPVRAAVVAQVRAASPRCRDATITGPRLLMVAATGRSTALAFGSGVWRWADLLS